MCRELLNKPTHCEYQIASRIATAPTTTTKNLNIDKIEAMYKRSYMRNKRLIVHQRYERRLASYKKKMHQFWDESFKETPVRCVKLIVGNRNNQNLTRDGIRRRPHIECIRTSFNESIVPYRHTM